MSYGQPLQEIVRDIQLNSVGQLFDIDYLLCFTIQMNALLFQFASQKIPFQIQGDTTDYNPTVMIVDDWQNVIRLLWVALKSHLTFAQQYEFNLLNEKFNSQRQET